MSTWLLTRWVWVALALMGLGRASLHAAESPVKTNHAAVSASEPTARTALTNVNELAPRNDALRDLERELNRSLRPFTPGSSLEGVVAPAFRPPRRPVVPDKKTKEMIMEKKDWIFMTPEELLHIPTLEDAFNLPQYDKDGRERKKLTPMERYYEALEARTTGRTRKSASPDDATRSSATGLYPAFGDSGRQDENLPDGLRESEQRLRKILGIRDRDSTPQSPLKSVRGSLEDIFGLGVTPLTEEQINAHKAYMQEYQKFLERPGPGLSPNPIAGALPGSVPGIVPQNPVLPGFGLPRGEGGGATVAGINPQLVPGALQDPSAKLLNQWNALYVLPKTEAPKALMPPVSFDLPRRKF
jgi:hypothetical protein